MTKADINQTLKLKMPFDRIDIDRATIGIEGRVFNMLIIGSKPKGGKYIEAVEQVYCHLRSVIYFSISDETINAPRIEISNMRSG